MERAELTRVWDAACEDLRAQDLGGIANAMFTSIQPLGYSDGIVVLSAPDDFSLAQIKKHHYASIQEVLNQHMGHPVQLAFTVAPPMPNQSLPPVVEPTSAPTYQPTVATTEWELNAPATPIVSNLVPTYTFDSFVMGASNRLAYSSALAVAEQPARTYNPLLIYGPSGLGKTHLLQAIGNYVREQDPASRVMYVTTEQFTNDFIHSIRTKNTHDFHQRYRSIDVLLIDDIQEVENKDQTQQEFFQTFNHLHLAGKQIVLTSDKHPNDLKLLTERLRTRFANGLVCDVSPPELETRLTILIRRCEAEGRDVPREVLEFIAHRVESNVRNLEGALTRVVAAASVNNLPITLRLAEDTLKDIYPQASQRKISADSILFETANYFEIPVDEIIGRSRTREIVNARHVAMYLTRELTDFSLPEIGKRFGNRDHSTVKHAHDRIIDLIDSNKELFQDIQRLTAAIKDSKHP